MDKKLIAKILFNAFIFCIIAVLDSDPSYGLVVINVELTSDKQTIEGFGGSGAFSEGALSSHPQKDEIYNAMFGGLGTSIYQIRNSYETGNSGDMLCQAEAIQAAEASLEQPVKILITSWTPPGYLKSNGTLARDSDGNYRYNDFAKWWADSLDAYQGLGIIPTYIIIQNEPSIIVPYPYCKFTEIETYDYAGYNSALEAVYQKLSTTMETPPKILAPDTINTWRAHLYIDAITNQDALFGYAHHLYSMGIDGDTQAERFDNPDSYINQMHYFRDNYGNKPIFQTEYCRLWDSDGFNEAINTAKHIHNSLVEENVVTYMVWGLFWIKDAGEDGLGLILIDGTSVPERGYTIRDTYYALKHYSKFIQPGYKRINISDPNVGGLRASAFKSPDEDTVVLVIINPEEESKGFSVSGLDGYIFYQVFRTDSSPDNNCTNIINNWDGNLPGMSITTIIYKSSGSYSYGPYTPVAPCRIADTRISQGGSGPIIGGTQRNFAATGGLCDVPFGPAKAVMINIVATNATDQGYLTAFAYPGTVPIASVLNYGSDPAWTAVSNGVIIPICNSDIHSCSFDFTVYAHKTTDVVIDVLGYFAPEP